MRKNDVKTFLKKNTGTILTVSSCICTGLTAYFGIQAGLKLANNDTDDKKEIVKTCLPVGLCCAGSIGLSVAADISNRKQITTLVNTCLLAGISYTNYREEVKKRYGEDVDAEIIATTIADNCAYHCTAPGTPDVLCHWILNTGDDRIPKIEFDAYEREVIHAEYHINRNYIIMGQQSITDVLSFFGKKPNNSYREYADTNGWKIDDNEVYFIDFEHNERLDTEEKTFEICPLFSPWSLLEDY